MTSAELDSLNNAFERFSKFDDFDESVILNALREEKVVSVVRTLFQYRWSLHNNIPYKNTFPNISTIVENLCSIKDVFNDRERLTESEYESLLREKYNLICEFVKTNSPSFEKELSSVLYIYTTNKINKVEECKSEIEEIQSEVKNYRNEVKEIYAKTGVHLFSKKYSDIAADESFAKVAWLIVACGFFIGAVWVVVLFTRDVIELQNKTYFDLLYLYAERIPAIAILLAFFVWVSKRYSIAREKEIIYRHLATTLHVFKAFYKTANPEHKSIVLMEAAKTLFPAPVDSSAGKFSSGEKMLDGVKLLSKVVTRQKSSE